MGAGRVGTAATALLQEAGHDIRGVASRTPASAERAAALLGSRRRDLDELVASSDVVLIGAPAAALAGIAESIAPGVAPGSVVIHFAGSHGVAPLHGVAQRGGRPLAAHPVQACPDVATALERLPGSAWGVTCSQPVRAWAFDLVRASLRGVPVAVAEDDRVLWHAAAVTTSNGIAALLAAGEAMLGAIGQPGAEVLGPLAAGTVANARAGGGGAATLTGPLVRGESDVIARHVASLRGSAPSLLESYMLVARTILAEGARAGRVDAPTQRRVAEILDRA